MISFLLVHTFCFLANNIFSAHRPWFHYRFIFLLYSFLFCQHFCEVILNGNKTMRRFESRYTCMVAQYLMVLLMLLIRAGSSEPAAHVETSWGNLICLRNLIATTSVSILDLFSNMTCFFRRKYKFIFIKVLFSFHYQFYGTT